MPINLADSIYYVVRYFDADSSVFHNDVYSVNNALILSV